MEENISYRKLKTLQPQRIKHTSQNLLKPYERNQSSQKLQNTIMSQNVTQYQYMLSNPHLKQNYIKWATNLRGYPYNKQKQKQATGYDGAPSVYYKKTLLGEQRQKLSKQSHSCHVNTAQYSQFFGKQYTNIPENQINFVCGLRKLKESQINKITHQQRFKNQGGKQNFSFLPKLLKKTAIKKLSGINQDDYEQQLDGSNKFPQYSYHNLKQKNSALINILSVNNKSNVSLPCVAWQIGLRNY